MGRKGKRSSLLAYFCDNSAQPRPLNSDTGQGTSMGREASLVHALVIIFLEYFAWGLLTVPVINVLAETFPTNKFLMNGLILGLKGLLSFLCSPLIGALSDVCGRKRFLLLTVFGTCMPIPCLKISPWWYFTLFTLSGFFSVTFTVILAFVADITDKHDRTTACGLVSATFAASLVTSPALGAWISRRYSDDTVVMLATIIWILDMLFILCVVPESLRSKNPNGGMSIEQVTWQNADPCLILRYISEDRTVFRLTAIVFLSYLPEAGQFSCFFVYLKLVVGFTPEAVAAFIGFVGILSVIAQTGILLLVTKSFGPKHAISIGLIFQFIQLVWYGVGSQHWMMWAAGFLAALSQMSYPSFCAFVSLQTDRELQGTVQGILSGIRGLCQGVGPAIFGLIFYEFGMDLSLDNENTGHIGVGPQFPVPNIRMQPFDKVITPTRNVTSQEKIAIRDQAIVPGPPFLLGATLVFIALLLNMSLPVGKKIFRRHHSISSKHMDTTLLMEDKE
ncbi:major facilitator superfamily domain-containing protein [Ditylenchus destructor]|uniref:Major facilitator superfamily domain-containing protein n=1 Tax=Ditylenchus destructor TaxID=166010 RepID=A0AAD4MJY1_9BILA|nr:major facilitator superfamily domain-containing protein [Ditylenchus destructor]